MTFIETLQTHMGSVKEDGIWGPKSQARLDDYLASGKVADVQQLMGGVTVDGKWGPLSKTRFNALITVGNVTVIHHVEASSFADPLDIARFKTCKASGGSDQKCFQVGDNGIGFWGDNTTGSVPMCALPPEDWNWLGRKARGAQVKVTVKATGRSAIVELRDTMPHKKNIRNNRGIDLNPSACKALGLTPPVEEEVTWQWV